MIQSNYIKTFGIAAYHTFFDSGKCNCLHFIPNHKTDKTFKKFGFKINPISNGFDLYSNTKSSFSDLLNYIAQTTQQDYFEFDIKCTNPNFILFTTLPINWIGAVTYSSQDPKNLSNNGKIVLNQTLENKPVSTHFGHLKIYFEDIITANTPLFQINFTARATQWQYYFINKNAVQLNNPSITEKENIQFEGPQNVTIPTGESALLFTSNKTYITLSEKPKYKFDLISSSSSSNQNNTKPKVIIKGLPNPDVSRIGIIENSDQNQVASPMYIYL
ncbi:hypothetical protein JI750_21755 [Flavobacterium sp. GN10]|uniref:Uncharacterized protein n=1 Tax=Flavobacterium tagetis TaxID=2801336 RepID=A0ABS1KJX7_9FLAO|nr:hypothetical protein [Flavobacterium tagetis]MBL0739532.1 hypothetical protein [Flavobacterium tagetis]